MKKLIASALSLTLALSLLVGCGKTDDNDSSAGSSTPSPSSKTGETISLKVWGAQEDQDMLKDMVEKFKETHTDNTYDITFGVVSESNAKDEVLKDVSEAADVFALASDQIAELQSAGGLYRVTKNKDEIIANNTEASIDAATVDGELYAYPSSSDTYFMFYDKSKLTEEDVESLETILAKDLGDDVINFGFDIANGWYQSSFFFATGCKLFGDDGTDPTQCDFNNDKGVLAGEYMIDLVNNKKFAGNYKDDQIKSGFETGKLAAAVTGTWNAADIQGYLGDNFAATKLPTIKLSDDSTVQMGGMANFKLYGVNAQTKHPVEAMELAEWLTNKDNQSVRFSMRSFAPTNRELANDAEALSADIAVSALAKQAVFSTVQTSIPQVGNYWDPAEAFGNGLMDGSITKDNLQEKLDTFVEAVLATLS